MSSIEVGMKEIYKLIEAAFANDQDIILKVRGTSMYPLMRDRKDSFKLTKIKDKLKKKDIVLYIRSNGDFVLHRIIKIKNGQYLITGDNQVSLETVNIEQMKGIVSEVHRKGKIIDCKKSIKYKCYVFFWCSSLFLRRIYLKLIRILKRISGHKQK